jgi:hypothetical protein
VGKLWLGIAIVCIVLLPIIFVVGGVMEGKVDLFKGVSIGRLLSLPSGRLSFAWGWWSVYWSCSARD